MTYEERPWCAESRRTGREAQDVSGRASQDQAAPRQPAPPRQHYHPDVSKLHAQGFVIAEVSVNSLTSLIITLPHNLVPCWQGPCLSC